MNQDSPENSCVLLQRLEEPLCDFCLSAGFFISSSPGTTQTAPSGRQFSFSIPSYATSRSGCVNSNNFHSSSFSPNIPELFSSFKKRKSLTLNEILDIVQNVWQAPKKSP
ncbi:hypothetical protein ABEB36_010890 [Hypothenemus hampei]|uniref:Uncharacterized protein n=1 Tax=Hypothenemus hampei TaxID=57062 RepID=A0ABD1EDN2_HYPHA